MKLLDETAFNQACGKMIPFRRHVPALIGQTYHCACGELHEVTHLSLIAAEGSESQFLIICPRDSSLVTLVQAHIRWVCLVDRLDGVVGHKTDFDRQTRDHS